MQIEKVAKYTETSTDGTVRWEVRARVREGTARAAWRIFWTQSVNDNRATLDPVRMAKAKEELARLQDRVAADIWHGRGKFEDWSVEQMKRYFGRLSRL